MPGPRTAAIVTSLAPPRRWIAVGGLALAAQLAWNLATPLRQVWPSPLHREMTQTRYLLSVRGPEEAGKTVCDGDRRPGTGLVLVNTCTWLYPLRDVAPAIPGRTIRRWPHPLQYVPYQYEVLNPEMRAVAGRADLSMRLIDQSGMHP